jgi:hypothetical protein
MALKPKIFTIWSFTKKCANAWNREYMMTKNVILICQGFLEAPWGKLNALSYWSLICFSLGWFRSSRCEFLGQRF